PRTLNSPLLLNSLAPLGSRNAKVLKPVASNLPELLIATLPLADANTLMENGPAFATPFGLLLNITSPEPANRFTPAQFQVFELLLSNWIDTPLASTPPAIRVTLPVIVPSLTTSIVCPATILMALANAEPPSVPISPPSWL